MLLYLALIIVALLLLGLIWRPTDADFTDLDENESWQ